MLSGTLLGDVFILVSLFVVILGILILLGLIFAYNGHVKEWMTIVIVLSWFLTIFIVSEFWLLVLLL